jgi:hypothetical protein
MRSKWTPQTYQIKQHADGRILTEQVFGQTRGGFGIHRTGDGWSVTHLKSGWATFMSRTEEGAKIIADYLIGSYAAEFERLNISVAQLKTSDCLPSGLKRTSCFGTSDVYTLFRSAS